MDSKLREQIHALVECVEDNRKIPPELAIFLHEHNVGRLKKHNRKVYLEVGNVAGLVDNTLPFDLSKLEELSKNEVEFDEPEVSTNYWEKMISFEEFEPGDVLVLGNDLFFTAHKSENLNPYRSGGVSFHTPGIEMQPSLREEEPDKFFVWDGEKVVHEPFFDLMVMLQRMLRC